MAASAQTLRLPPLRTARGPQSDGRLLPLPILLVDKLSLVDLSHTLPELQKRRHPARRAEVGLKRHQALRTGPCILEAYTQRLLASNVHSPQLLGFWDGNAKTSLCLQQQNSID